MNYSKVYYFIIEKRKTNPIPKDEYSELHHIVPKCLGGNDKKYINDYNPTQRKRFK